MSVRWQAARSHGGEVRELRQRDVDLERGAGVVDVLDGGYELGLQLLLLEQIEERDVRVGVRDDLLGLELGPPRVRQRHALHPTAAGGDLPDGAVYADLPPVRARRGFERPRDCPPPPPPGTPPAPHPGSHRPYVVGPYLSH